MPPAVKIREFLAAKTNAKAGTVEAKSSTPLWKQKLQSRTGITPTTTPVAARKSSERPQSDLEGDAGTLLPETASTSYGQGQQSSGSQEPAATGIEAQLKLTLIQAPLLPKPELSRPKPPPDRAALLRQLQSLRSAGAEILSSSTSDLPSLPPAAPPLDTSFQSPVRVAPSTPLAFASSAASATPAAGFSFPAPAASSAAAAPSSPSPLHRPPGLLAAPPSPMTPSASPAPFLSTPVGGRAAERTPPPPLSPPTMAGLRLQEAHDTGGGFLTHYADPATLATPSQYGRGGGGGASRRSSTGLTTPGVGGGGGGGGSSTPLSVLRSIHRVQQLQRLQREGAQLVAAIGGPDS